MSTLAQSNRLQLKIDVLTLPQQSAWALPELTPVELIEAIVQEFTELEYLSNRAQDYVLHQRVSGELKTLIPSDPLQGQIGNGSHLVLKEVERTAPPGTRAAPQVAYLRDITHGRVFHLDWLPAIIGRPDPNRSHNDRIIVDLQSFEYGLRVSRRHAQITAEGNQFYIENLANNPTLVSGKLLQGRVPLQHGTHILLERSNITLKFILRDATLPIMSEEEQT